MQNGAEIGPSHRGSSRGELTRDARRLIQAARPEGNGRNGPELKRALYPIDDLALRHRAHLGSLYLTAGEQHERRDASHAIA